MKKTISYVFDEDSGLDFAAIRVTVGTINLGELGEYSKLMRIYGEHTSQEMGGDWDKMSDEQKLAVDPALVTVSRLWRPWAHMRSCLKKIEVRLEADGEWVEAGLEDLGWESLKGLATLPLDLFHSWDDWAQKCNPGIFGPVYGQDEESEKKVGVISVE